jgi:hypothetical protein
MQNPYELDSVSDEQKQEDLAKVQWQRKAYKCVQTQNSHEFVPVSWTISKESKHVSMVMCMRCFHHINIADAWKHGPNG